LCADAVADDEMAVLMEKRSVVTMMALIRLLAALQPAVFPAMVKGEEADMEVAVSR